MTSAVTPLGLLSILLPLVVWGLAMLVLWVVIRTAVLSALRTQTRETLDRPADQA